MGCDVWVVVHKQAPGTQTTEQDRGNILLLAPLLLLLLRWRDWQSWLLCCVSQQRCQMLQLWGSEGLFTELACPEC